MTFGCTTASAEAAAGRPQQAPSSSNDQTGATGFLAASGAPLALVESQSQCGCVNRSRSLSPQTRPFSVSSGSPRRHPGVSSGVSVATRIRTDAAPADVPSASPRKEPDTQRPRPVCGGEACVNRTGALFALPGRLAPQKTPNTNRFVSGVRESRSYESCSHSSDRTPVASANSLGVNPLHRPIG